MDLDLLYAEIDAAAVTHNCAVLRSFAPPDCRLCVAVKANAYGHGMALLLPAFRAAGVDMFGVATVREAEELRRLGCDEPILLFGPVLNARTGPDRLELAQWLVENDIRVTATSAADIAALGDAAKSMGRRAWVHLKLDTGMSRMGLHQGPMAEVIDAAVDHPAVVFEGLYTHFATADDDKAFAGRQLRRLQLLVDRLVERGIRPPIVHAANSAATIDLPGSHLDMIRPGISVYGYHASPAMTNRPDFRPALRVIGSLTLIKEIPAGSYVGYGCTFQAHHDMLVGLVPVGYADGYDRRLSNFGRMIIAGRSAPVVGRVSMDQTVIDLSAFRSAGHPIAPGDEVIIIDNDRNSPNSVEAIARQLDTIPYEITTLLGPRVIRRLV